jgi:hypothetical protein
LQEQIRTLGKIFIGFGVFGLVMAGLLLWGYGGFSGLLAIDPEAKRNDVTTIPLDRLIALAYLGFSVLMAGPLIAVGRGILQWQHWAYTGGVLTGAACLLLFPIGTGVGIYALWLLLLPEAEPVFLNQPLTRTDGSARPR